MMYLRFIVISLLLFFGIASTLFTAFHFKGENNDGSVFASAKEVPPKNVYIVAAAAAARENIQKGWKMVADKSAMPKGKQTNRRTTLLGNKNANYVAFTQDYNKPRHHPPKNN